MNWKSVGKALAGGIMGLMLGTMAGVTAVIAIVSRNLPPVPQGEAVGIDVNVFLRSGIFWMIVLACTLGLGFLATHIGRGTRQPQL